MVLLLDTGPCRQVTLILKFKVGLPLPLPRPLPLVDAFDPSLGLNRFLSSLTMPDTLSGSRLIELIRLIVALVISSILEMWAADAMKYISNAS